MGFADIFNYVGSLFRKTGTTDVNKLTGVLPSTADTTKTTKALGGGLVIDTDKIKSEALTNTSNLTGTTEEQLVIDLGNVTKQDCIDLRGTVTEAKKLAKTQRQNYFLKFIKTGGTVATGGGILGMFLFQKASGLTAAKNAAKLNVVSITNNGSNTAILKYSPSLQLCSYDQIIITNTNPSEPLIEGKTLSINKITSDSEVIINTEGTLSKVITGGDMKINSDVLNQMQCDIETLQNSIQNSVNTIPSILMYCGYGIGIVLVIFIVIKVKRTMRKHD